MFEGSKSSSAVGSAPTSISGIVTPALNSPRSFPILPTFTPLSNKFFLGGAAILVIGFAYLGFQENSSETTESTASAETSTSETSEIENVSNNEETTGASTEAVGSVETTTTTEASDTTETTEESEENTEN